MKLTPLELRFLLHCYYSPARFECIDTEPVRQFAIVAVNNYEILELGDAPYTYKLTERGKAYVEHILSTPLPVQVWQRGEL